MGRYSDHQLVVLTGLDRIEPLPQFVDGVDANAVDAHDLVAGLDACPRRGRARLHPPHDHRAVVFPDGHAEHRSATHSDRREPLAQSFDGGEQLTEAKRAHELAQPVKVAAVIDVVEVETLDRIGELVEIDS